jgi:hypothetical protein
VKKLVCLTILSCLLASRLSAALAVGEVVPVFAAKDQHGRDYVFTNGPAYLLAATDMSASKLANQKIAEQGVGYLEKKQAVYVLDIHTMPAVARLFAFPKMRKYPQRMILVDAAETLAAYPAQAGRVTVLTLAPDRKIRAIHFWDPLHEPLADVLK